jgi:hypothetical protein
MSARVKQACAAWRGSNRRNSEVYQLCWSSISVDLVELDLGRIDFCRLDDCGQSTEIGELSPFANL